MSPARTLIDLRPLRVSPAFRRLLAGRTVSMLGGTMTTVAVTRYGRPGPLMLCGAASWGAALALSGLTTNIWTGLALLVVAGAADTVSVISRGTIVQTRTPDALRGRVTAAEQIVGRAGPQRGNLRGGLVAHWTSGATALVSGGLPCLLAVVWVGAGTPELRDRTTPDVP